MKCVDDFRLKLGGRELVPIVIGGMGVDISTTELALEAARLGGIGHISDAMIKTVSDRRYDTKFVSAKQKRYKHNVANVDKSEVKFDLADVAEATRLHVQGTMEAKRGEGLIFINCMEKLTMNAPKDTLRVRLRTAMDHGIDGITLAAGLHLGSFALIEDHPRFRDVKLGIIVSSLRALQLFLRKSARSGRLPDYVVVEGPLAGGHLGFGLDDWMKHDLRTITDEILAWLKQEELAIPVIPAGGIFTGTDAVSYLETGAAAVQVATRFTVTKECGLPVKVQQEYFKAGEEDIEVNGISPMADGGHVAARVYREVAAHPGAKKISVRDKTCLCTHMRNFDCWTCGANTYRLKDTSRKLADGSYQLLTAEHVFRDYQFSKDGRIALPE